MTNGMTESKLKELYFEWLCRFVCYSEKEAYYSKLLRFLHQTAYYYILPMDGNRESDGIGLRYRFSKEMRVPQSAVASVIDISQCSMLEMLIALSIRCEESIMSNDGFGDRTGQWFWNMIVNLGLGYMTDERFDIQEASKIISRFLNREYGPNGEGGIVRVYNHGDLRNIDIWYQIMWYLNEFE